MPRRHLDELADTIDPAWLLVQGWLAQARNPVEILPAERQRGERTLLHLQVTSHSTLGALALETGGAFFDHGWLRFLGSGCERMQVNLLNCNPAKPDGAFADPLIVAHDAVGGLFGINGGALPGAQGGVYYFAPDTLEWQSLEFSYTDLLQWAAGGDLTRFYEGMRWPGWEAEVATLSGDEVLSIYPYLWSNGPPIGDRSRRSVPVVEFWKLEQGLAGQVGSLPDGARIQIGVDD